MNWKHIKNIDKSQGFAEMFIYDEISDAKVNGSSFAYELRHLVNYEGVKLVKIKVNSVGGDVMHAQTIVSEMIDAIEKGVIIETHGQGLMASSAGVVFLTAKKENRYIKDYARLMVHGVSPAEQKDLNEADKTALENFKSILVQILSNRTGKKNAFFEELFTNKKDNWFNAKEMIKNGFVLKENVEKTDIKVDIENEKTAGVVVVFNKLKTTIENNINTNQIKMKKVIALLKLQDGVSEDVIETAVKTIQNSLKTAEETVTATQNKLEKVEADLATANIALSAQNKAAAADFVKNCVKNGQISPEKEAEVLVQAEANLEGFKNLMSAIPVKAANIMNQIGKEGEEQPSTETRTFRQLEKEAPEVLNTMRKTNLKSFVNLYNAEYKTNKTEADFQ